jgi:hypothetical protein
MTDDFPHELNYDPRFGGGMPGPLGDNDDRDDSLEEPEHVGGYSLEHNHWYCDTCGSLYCRLG